MPTLPPVTRAIIIANIAVFLLQLATGDLLVAHFALWSTDGADSLFQPWQLLTYAFLHANFLHIFFNMFAIYMFGSPLEMFWGGRRYAFYFLACLLTAAATELVVMNATGVDGPVIGASGGVFGLLLAFAWYFPRQRLFIIPIPIPLPAWLFVTIYGVAELSFGVTGIQPGVAHFAHLGGMLGGALAILYWRARGRFTG